MKRILFGAIVVSLFHLAAPLSIANAADMPVKSAPVWAPPLETGPLWEGIYMGFNGGGVWDARTSWCTDTTVITCSTGKPVDVGHFSTSGAMAGGQFGDRWQWGNVVVGVEGLIDWTVMGQRIADPASGTLKTSFDGIMSVTGSLGWAFDRVMVYGKGGWALTDLKAEAAPPGTANFISGNTYASGWTAGAGIEYQVIPHLIVGVEYDYYRFDPGTITNLTSNIGNAVPCGFCNFGSTSMQTVIGRVTLQAGPPPAWH
jgi:outer membrane immunogenic protein